MSAYYITPAQLPTYYDARRVLQLASDTDTPADASDLSDTGSAAYAIVLAALRSASSEIDTHLQQGKRYTRANLEAIITAALAAPTDEAKNKRAGMIRQLAADLAYGFLIARRGMSADTLNRLCPRYKEAQALLERLAVGQLVFDLDANINAGVPTTATIGQNVYRPSADNRLFGIWSDWPGDSRNFFGRW